MPDYPEGLGRDSRPKPPEALPLGERIRALRKAAGRTLENVSAASGVSRAALSKIERGEMSPTYESLLKLARGLGVDLATLVSGRKPAGGGSDVTRAGKGVRHATEGYVHHLLAPDLPERALFAFVTEVRVSRLPDAESWHRHESEDFLYVLEGAVAVHLADRHPVELREGDSMQMDGRTPHALVALPSSGEDGRARKRARVLWVSVPFA